MNKFRVRKTDDIRYKWTVADGISFSDTNNYINKYGRISDVCPIYVTKAAAQTALDLYLSDQLLLKSKSDEEEKQPNKIRQFDTGATRDANDHPDKPSYYKALSPIVLREYVKYLGRHRTMADGSQRDWDNWKNGIPIGVYMDGLLRHVMAVWLIQQGFKSYDNNGEVNLKDSLYGVLFNSIGMLHEILKNEKLDRNKPVPGGY